MLHPLLLAPHIGAGAIGLAVGLVAMFARKSRGLPAMSGQIYQGATVMLVITSLGLVALDWSALWFLRSSLSRPRLRP